MVSMLLSIWVVCTMSDSVQFSSVPAMEKNSSVSGMYMWNLYLHVLRPACNNSLIPLNSVPISLKTKRVLSTARQTESKIGLCRRSAETLGLHVLIVVYK